MDVLLAFGIALVILILRDPISFAGDDGPPEYMHCVSGHMSLRASETKFDKSLQVRLSGHGPIQGKEQIVDRHCQYLLDDRSWVWANHATLFF